MLALLMFVPNVWELPSDPNYGHQFQASSVSLAGLGGGKDGMVTHKSYQHLITSLNDFTHTFDDSTGVRTPCTREGAGEGSEGMHSPPSALAFLKLHALALINIRVSERAWRLRSWHDSARRYLLAFAFSFMHKQLTTFQSQTVAIFDKDPQRLLEVKGTHATHPSLSTL
jgi:hypothetical protein